MSADFLDIFDGEEISGPAAVRSSDVDLMYKPAEPIFGALAKQLVDNGWSVFPQDQERRPGRVDGDTIAWSAKHALPLQLPTPEALQKWVAQCPTLNIGCAMGQGSGFTFALDIDVLDEDLSQRISNLADEMLGETPLVRVGKAPKIALFYRYNPEDPVVNISRTFAKTNDKGEFVATENALEVLTQGKPITFMGKHHTTGRYFHWLRKSPMEVGPEAAPIVSSEKLAFFLEAVDENIQRFHRNTTLLSDIQEVSWDESHGVNVPKLNTVAGDSPWVEKEGKIVDGREAYLTKLVYSFVRTNPGMPEAELTRAVTAQFCQDADTSTSRWNPRNVEREARNKISRLLGKVKEGAIQIDYKTGTSNNEDEAPSGRFRLGFSKKDLEDRGLGFLPDHHKRLWLRGNMVEKGDPVVLTDQERQSQIQDIQTGLRDALDEFFEDVFMSNGGRVPGENRVHVIKAPTGAGKTSQTIRYIGEKKAEHDARARAPRMDGARDDKGKLIHPAQGLESTYEDSNGNLRDGTMPIVFLLPTYANIEEVRVRAEVLNLDASMTDEELKEAALEKGLVPQHELESRLADMKRDAMDAGLNVLVYKGKIAAGCKVPEKVQAAMDAGIGSSGFCRAPVKRDDGSTEIIHCPHYFECPAITQKEKIQEADLIFTPHPFMQLEIPEELHHVRAVIADERIHHLFLHTAEFPLIHLSLPRKSVRLTKDERQRGITEDDLAFSREEAVAVVREALMKDKCPAQALYDLRSEDGQVAMGATWVEDCIRICSNALKKDAKLTPELELEEVVEMCAQPSGLHIREELQFWKIIQERIHGLTHQNLVKAAIENSEALLARSDDPEKRKSLATAIRVNKQLLTDPCMPKHTKDLRIQRVKDHVGTGHVRDLVRISWRTTPNWAEVPMMLLDASAAPEIIQKIWGGAEVKTHDISGPLNMKVVGIVDRTFSNSSVIGSPDDNDFRKLLTAKNFAKLRSAISSISSWFGWSRVVAGSSILVRKTINTDWAGPENVDWCHFGAMRGLDFAKFHAAAVSIGRMELPVRTIDGLVAALTYDDNEPELPFDKDGTGMSPTNPSQPLMMPSKLQRLKLRSGEIVEIPTPMHPGKWGRLIQKQYREEELLQFCGRLRPVYREGEAPIWFAMSSVIPDNLVIDDLIHIDDLVKSRSFFWDAVRRTHGIIHPDVLLETCPELFKDREQAMQMMQTFGFSYRHGSQTGAMSEGFTRVKILSDRPESFAFVKTWVENPVEALGEALKAHGVDYDQLVAEPAPRPRDALARSRTADNIEEALGTLEERAKEEEIISKEAEMSLFSRGLRRADKVDAEKKGYMPSHPLSFQAGTSATLKKVSVRFSDMEALSTLKKVWSGIAYERDLASSSPIIQAGEEGYAEYGNHLSDQD